MTSDTPPRLAGRVESTSNRPDGPVDEAPPDSPAKHDAPGERAGPDARAAARRASIPPLRYPADLPVSARREDLVAAITAHQVVIVAGETGSGKSTQLPKLCLEAGRGITGLIGHTQPRRLAARAVAERVAAELGQDVGGLIGYAVRFTDKVSDATLVKVMTDGILLAEIQRDRMLRRYDTIIIDEAHERSLNIDFLLGYLTWLCTRRPDLKIIITSATIDTARFAAHFGDAPVIEVSGRAFPVEVRYRPLEGGAGAGATDRDQTQGICDAVDELCAEGPGDILVFLSGEREIRDTADALREQQRPATEILPLYARLSLADQHRVFAAHRGRRVVLATNVAETSLTVPGVRSVVDTGTARISRYNRRTKVQRLPIEPISQASANQRAGRCGRIGPGICIRLYEENDFAARAAFTEPEILRTNLASVILQMAALRLGDIASFPFVEAPDRRAVKDGIALLEELGALDPDHENTKRWLTPLGRRLARLPVDPRLGRMILEADRLGCVREVTIIAAALSIQDPRERPSGAEQAAAEKHRRFLNPDSDLLAYLTLWSYLQERQHELSSNQFRKLCRTEYLNYLRVREWQDLVAQLRRVTNQLDIRTNHDEPPPNNVHRALLAGLLSHIGLRDPERGDYLGARGARFTIAPGSGLQKQTLPRWIMAAELVETNRLWARKVARIQPGWAEGLAPQLLTHHYSDPHWSAERGCTMATERVTLFGLPLVAGRRVDFGRVDPAVARELFIRHALIEGDWSGNHRFTAHNRTVLEELRDHENRLRRDLAPDDDDLFRFYDARVGRDATSAGRFERWWKTTRHDQPELLHLQIEDLLADADTEQGAYPDSWHAGDLELALSYCFDPGDPADGVTVTIPIGVLSRLHAGDFDWLVPGLRLELVTALLRQLPKVLRKEFVPVPEHAASILASLDPAAGPLREVLIRRIAHRAGRPVPLDTLDDADLPDHLRMRFEVTDRAGAVLATGRDLAALQDVLGPRVRATLRHASAGFERSGQRSWTFGAIPRVLEPESDGPALLGFPALVDEGESVGLRLLATADSQHGTHWEGTRRLLRLTTASPSRALRPVMNNEVKLAAARSGLTLTDFVEDIVVATFDHLLDQAGGPVWNEADFVELRRDVAAAASNLASRVAADAAAVLRQAAKVRVQLDTLTNPRLTTTVNDVMLQLSDLVHPGFVQEAGIDKLADLQRYLQAVERRLDKAARDPNGDMARLQRIHELERDFDRLVGQWPPGEHPPQLERVRWLLEELRVATFAQVLGTSEPVSEIKLRAALDDLRRLA